MDQVRTAEWATVMFVVFVSLGEAIWSPRWYDYSMSVAPEVRASRDHIVSRVCHWVP
jgi:hypothetical protein